MNTSLVIRANISSTDWQFKMTSLQNVFAATNGCLQFYTIAQPEWSQLARIAKKKRALDFSRAPQRFTQRAEIYSVSRTSSQRPRNVGSLKKNVAKVVLPLIGTRTSTSTVGVVVPIFVGETKMSNFRIPIERKTCAAEFRQRVSDAPGTIPARAPS